MNMNKEPMIEEFPVGRFIQEKRTYVRNLVKVENIKIGDVVSADSGFNPEGFTVFLEVSEVDEVNDSIGHRIELTFISGTKSAYRVGTRLEFGLAPNG